ncbi:MAG: hypothetical protein C0621_05435 [Desulfuromonas sp.]|nr:MAG: hypothetical protein C0621_05435 [Desulfuromonas sp.]
MDIDGIIFDCDGVLFESRQANLAYYNEILRQFDVPEVRLGTDEAALCHTASSPVVLEELVGKERVADALIVASALDYRQFIPFMEPEPEMATVVAELSRHYTLGVATNRGSSMHELLEHFSLDSYFSSVVTSRDVPRPKPYPDMLLLSSQQLTIPHERLLFVGDSELDRQAARGAGIRFVSYKGEAKEDLAVSGHRQLWEMVSPQG